jgi:hypothetical protein
VSLSPEEVARLQAGVEQVRQNILEAMPAAGGAECGGLFDAYGSVQFTPVRDPLLDYSAWGDWEAWEHQKPEGAQLVPSGDWVAWHAPSGQMIGFPSPNARMKAEGCALLWNEGAPTRVVPAAGGFQRSYLNYEHIRAKVAEAEAGSGSS